MMQEVQGIGARAAAARRSLCLPWTLRTGSAERALRPRSADRALHTFVCERGPGVCPGVYARLTRGHRGLPSGRQDTSCALSNAVVGPRRPDPAVYPCFGDVQSLRSPRAACAPAAGPWGPASSGHGFSGARAAGRQPGHGPRASGPGLLLAAARLPGSWLWRGPHQHEDVLPRAWEGPGVFPAGDHRRRPASPACTSTARGFYKPSPVHFLLLAPGNSLISSTHGSFHAAGP